MLFCFFAGMRKKILIALAASIAIFFILRWQGKTLVTEKSPLGIISFELLNKQTVANELIQDIGKTPLRINIAIDFVFIIAYGFLFFLSCKALMNHFRSAGMKKMGFIFMELGVLVGVLDLCENITMLITIADYGSQISVDITRWLAIAKFMIAALVVLYLITSFVVTRFTKEKQIPA